VKEEIAISANEEGFQDVSGDDIVEFLESLSLPLTNEEMSEMDMSTYKEAKNDDDESENTLTIKRFKRKLQQN
jgi:hypothetical protein